MPVDFFIAGAQKAGTTALDIYLRQHPCIQMANVKEVHFFDDETIDWAKPDFSKLHGAFDWSAEWASLRGEATPIYMYWPNCLARLRQYNGAAKIIVLLRHPAFRAHSQWRMEARRGMDTFSFAEAITPVGRQRVLDMPNKVHRVFSYVERGFYSAQIERLFNLFPRERVLFFRTDQLWTAPMLFLMWFRTFCVSIGDCASSDRI
jgi:hypothetical protein